MADQTPEERAEKVCSVASVLDFLNRRVGLELLDGDVVIVAHLVHEIEESARKKAFEEAAKKLRETAADRRADGRRGDARYYDHAAEIVRALTEALKPEDLTDNPKPS